MNVFVKKNDTVQVDVFIWDNEKNEVQATVNETEVPRTTDAKILKFIFRQPSYADSQSIIKQSQVQRGDYPTIDAVTFQDVIIHTLLVDWDMKAVSDETPCTSPNINNLHPVIARVAVEGVMSKITI